MAETLISVYGGMFDSTEVVETVDGFPRGNKAVDSEFFARMITCFWSDGVLGSDSFKVSAGDGLSLSVASGIAWAKGYMAWQKTNLSVTVAAGMSYTVALRLDCAVGEFSLVLSDAADFTPQNTENVRELVLATVSIPTGALSVTSEHITDKRGDTSLCGIVTSTIDALGAVENAQNANNLGGEPADAYLKKSGGTMTGVLKATADSSGTAAVRNIGYGTSLPATLGEGELFVLIST